MFLDKTAPYYLNKTHIFKINPNSMREKVQTLNEFEPIFIKSHLHPFLLLSSRNQFRVGKVEFFELGY